jgi:hypothetical protein
VLVFCRDAGERLVDEANGAIADRSADEDAGGTVRDLLLDEPELGDGFAEGLAIDGVANAVVERNASAADGCISEFVAADVEDVERDVMALADLSEEVRGGDDAIVKDERAGGAAANAELVLFFPYGESGSAPLDEEGGEFFFAGVGAVGDCALRER